MVDAHDAQLNDYDEDSPMKMKLLAMTTLTIIMLIITMTMVLASSMLKDARMPSTTSEMILDAKQACVYPLHPPF